MPRNPFSDWFPKAHRDKVSVASSLRRWRWAIAIGSFVLVFGLETLEGHAWANPDFWLEVTLLGVVVPSGLWAWLTYLAQNLERQTYQRALLEKRRRFIRHLAQNQSWEELTRFITHYPSSLMPVEFVELYIQDNATRQLRLVASWGAIPASETTPPISNLCRTCLSMRQFPNSACSYSAAQVEGEHGCWPLVHQSKIIGVLRLRCHAIEALPTEAVKLLDMVTPEIALALTRSLAVHGQMTQVRVAAQAYERRQIAQALHNSLAQQVGFLHLSLDHLGSDERLTVPAEVRDEVRYLRDVAGEAYKNIRDTLAFLRSREQADLLQSIIDHVETVTRTTGLRIAITAHGESSVLSPEMGSKLFSLVQESVNNIIKHAHAQQAEVSLHWSAERLTIVVRDNGVGFAVEPHSPDGHFGVTMMREVIEDLGGSLLVESAPGQGAQLRFSVPLQVPPEAHAPLQGGWTVLPESVLKSGEATPFADE